MRVSDDGTYIDAGTTIASIDTANDTITFYANNGDYIGRVAAAFSILLLIWTFVKRFSTEKIN